MEVFSASWASNCGGDIEVYALGFIFLVLGSLKALITNVAKVAYFAMRGIREVEDLRPLRGT
jgi:hypothetical protein